MKRRDFINKSALGTGTLLIGIHIPGCKMTDHLPSVAHQLNAYLSLDTHSQVTISIPVPEIGQGVRTALAMLVMEELEANWDQVKIEQCDGDAIYGGRDQRAAGSNSIRVFWEPLRTAGAQAREMLKQAAAYEWGIPSGECEVAGGMVFNKVNRKKFRFGQLIEKASKLEIPKQVELKKSGFNVLGGAKPNIDNAAIVAGKSTYGFDVQFDGMLYASIEKCPTYGGKVIAFDATESLKIRGVRSAFKVNHYGSSADRPYTREGVAVVGESSWAVICGRRALKIEWDRTANQKESTGELDQQCKSLIDGQGDEIIIDQGNTRDAIKRAGRVFEATYKLPFIAHIPMEPLNCVINLTEDRCEIWSGTQMPFAERQFLAGLLDMPVEQITLHVPRIGGGFGRRLGYTAAIEAVQIAQEIKEPVKLFWTREDDIVHDGYRPFSYHRMTAAWDDVGALTSWTHRQAGTSRYAFRPNNRPGESEFFPNHFPANLLPNFRQEYSLAISNLSRSLIRAPGNNALAFVVESFMDELAIESDSDPLEFRLQLLGEDRDFPFDEEEGTVISTQRMKKVLSLAAEKAGWSNRKTLSPGRGMGIAGYFTFDSYIAHVAEVSVHQDTGDLHIHRFVSAVDCGFAVNRAGVIAQVEGAILDGLSAAIHQEVTIAEGQPQQSNFHDYPVLRMSECPDEIEVFIVENEHPPTGMGEPPYPPVAPALCNAIYDASKVRIRVLPIRDQIKKKIVGVPS